MLGGATSSPGKNYLQGTVSEEDTSQGVHLGLVCVIIPSWGNDVSVDMVVATKHVPRLVCKGGSRISTVSFSLAPLSGTRHFE